MQSKRRNLLNKGNTGDEHMGPSNDYINTECIIMWSRDNWNTLYRRNDQNTMQHSITC